MVLVGRRFGVVSRYRVSGHFGSWEQLWLEYWFTRASLHQAHWQVQAMSFTSVQLRMSQVPVSCADTR